MFKRLLTGVVSLTAISALSGCSGGDSGEKAHSAQLGSTPAPTQQVRRSQPRSRTFSKAELLRKLKYSGLQLENMDTRVLDASDLQAFPRDPDDVFTVRIKDGKGNSTPVTFVQFRSADEVARIRGVNGFKVHNWFLHGLTGTYFRDRVTAAIE